MPLIPSKLSFLLLPLLLAVSAPADPEVETNAKTMAPSMRKDTRPSLAVIVVVDGLSTEQLLKYRPWYVAGLKRLLDEGHVETKNRYRHINTETGPGHASLGTGAPPRVSGIVANTWFEAASAGKGLKPVYCTDSPEPDPSTGRAVPGPFRLQVDSLGDRLLATSPLSRVFSVSAKDRSAIFMAGRSKSHAAFWFDRATRRFATSSAYAPAGDARAVVGRFNETSMGDQIGKRFGGEWHKLSLPDGSDKLPRATPAAALVDYQLPINGLLFPHAYRLNPRGLGEAYYDSPVVDELVGDLAVSFLEDPEIRLGKRGVTDLLAVSFSAHDLVSHYYGPESEETLDVLRRVDAQIARLFNALDRLLPGKVVLGFSADHGFSPIPEAARTRDRSAEGGRLVTSPRMLNNFPDKANRMLRDELCLAPGPHAVQLSDGWIVSYTPGVERVEGRCGPARPITKADVDQVLPRVMASLYTEEIQEIRLNSQMASWPKDDLTTMILNDFYPGRSGDAFIVPRRRVIQHWDPGRGSGHGSAHDYDTNVPLIFWGKGFKATSSDADDASPYDLAVTLGDAVGVSLPDATGKSRLPRPAQAPRF